MSLSRLAIAGVALLVTASLPLARAQATSNVTCQPAFQWMLNSKSQSPCLASAYLSGQCNDGQWNVPTLSNGGPYNHPAGDTANLCRCNTITYNLLQACSVCQGGLIGPWSDWISNCTAANTTTGSYPMPLPAGVAIPGWAYIDFSQQDSFQTITAQQATAPESVSAPAATQIQTSATGNAAPTRAASSTTGVVPTGLPVSGSSKSSGSNVGPIVGGVVGGVLGLALIALITFVLLRRKKQKNMAPSDQFAAQPTPGQYGPPDNGYMQQQPYNTSQYAPVPVSQAGVYDQAHSMHSQPYNVPGTPGTVYKTYDPSDPSTFPGTPAPGGAPTMHSQGPPHSEYGQQQPRPGQYNYTAEL